MQLEALCHKVRAPLRLPLSRAEDGVLRSDWEPLLELLLDERRCRSERAEIFHASLAAVILDQARQVRAAQGVEVVGLCGGVFQNRVLTELAVDMLRDNGFVVHLPRQVPCNDGGLCVGQLAEIAARDRRAAG